METDFSPFGCLMKKDNLTLLTQNFLVLTGLIYIPNNNNNN